MVILLVLIVISAFFSACETAFSSVNRIRLKNYAEEKRRGSKKALDISNDFDRTLSTILVGNNIVNIAAASISTKVATDMFGVQGLLYSTILMTFIILIFGEILPKSIAKDKAEDFALATSGLLSTLIKLFIPITFFFIKLKSFVSKYTKDDNKMPSITEEEIKVMVEISEEEGTIGNNEAELVQRSLDFNDILVGEVTTPRIDIIAVEVNQSIEEIRDVFLEERYSRIPVYEDSIDNIIGILSEREFLSELVQNNEINVRELIRDPYFVVESMQISTLLPELQKAKVHMAIVVDEFGGTSGLITLEDILEELVGDIWDEHDETVRNIIKINENCYEFNAELPLDEFVETFEMKEPVTDYHTLGGWIIEKFGKIPKQNDSFMHENLVIKVHQIDNRRIRKVRVYIKNNIVEPITE
jgi:CBS domain containing-hemolysin-like protein